MKKYFLDLHKLTKEDFGKIRKHAKDFNLGFDVVLYEWGKENPGKITVLGEFNNGVVHVDEITEDGVTEYNGVEAMAQILKQIRKNKEEKDR